MTNHLLSAATHRLLCVGPETCQLLVTLDDAEESLIHIFILECIFYSLLYLFKKCISYIFSESLCDSFSYVVVCCCSATPRTLRLELVPPLYLFLIHHPPSYFCQGLYIFWRTKYCSCWVDGFRLFRGPLDIIMEVKNNFIPAVFSLMTVLTLLLLRICSCRMCVRGGLTPEVFQMILHCFPFTISSSLPV